MITPMSRRIKEPPVSWEVVDVEEAALFVTSDPQSRDDFKAGIELRGHRAIVRKVRS